MIREQNNISIKEYNTFKIDAKVKRIIHFDSVNDIPLIRKYFKEGPYLILGGGSNVLFTSDFNGVVIKPDMKEINIVRESDNQVVLKVDAGFDWDEFVKYCIDHDFGGVENLSNIPGNVGASPIQNIGAYGVEVKDVIESVEFYNIEDNIIHCYNNEQCKFGYRESVFKNELSNKTIILSVNFSLTKSNHRINTKYGNIEEEVSGSDEITIANIRNAIVKIRNAKLPDPEVTGNAGSFFKNPVIDKTMYLNLKEKFSELPSFIINNEYYKIPAAWLIENCGWKGSVSGNAAVHDKQPLVLINFNGKAKGSDVLNLANKIVSDVFDRFGIHLKMEVNKV